ncbi:MAG: putative sulfate exporter family transporter [Thermoleophilia bacterium]|nr:putative sulfate exporter family transporter [Thermoleophilia bacterium]
MRAAPGLALAGIGVALSLGAHRALQDLPPLVLCVALGIALANIAHVPQSAAPGLKVAGGPVLKLGVVLLGLDLVFPDILALGFKALLVVVGVVMITFFGTRWAGRKLGLSDDLSLLVATGFSICGVSAIAAANGVIDTDEDEVAFSVALVTLCGTLAIVTLPPLQGVLGLDDEQFGAWVGASVHDVAQVVATSSTAGSVALATAIVVKLTRVMLLAPLIAGIALRHRQTRSERGERPPLVPPFIIAFIGMVVIASIGIVSDRVLVRIDDLRTVVLGMALFALGTRVNVGRMRQLGARPLALGLASWLLIAVVAYAGVRLAWA